MPKQKYREIYRHIRQDIENRHYESGELLPSEHEFTKKYHCSRNTVRRAIAMLASDGYVQTMQGKGMRCLYRPGQTLSFFSGEIETFREAAERNGIPYRTEVVLFEAVCADLGIAGHTGLPENAELYHILRIHFLNHKPAILNESYFLKSVALHLTKETAEKSIYQYLENEIGVVIVNTKRTITVERKTDLDEAYLHLAQDGIYSLAVVSSQTYDGDGILFEYTQSRHRPDYFYFTNTAVRRKRLVK